MEVENTVKTLKNLVSVLFSGLTGNAPRISTPRLTKGAQKDFLPPSSSEFPSTTSPPTEEVLALFSTSRAGFDFSVATSWDSILTKNYNCCVKPKFDIEENPYICIKTASSQSRNPETNSAKLEPMIGSTIVLDYPRLLIVARISWQGIWQRAGTGKITPPKR